jgi:hypothetical protein
MSTCIWPWDVDPSDPHKNVPCPRPPRNRFAALCEEHLREANHRFSKARRRDKWNKDDFLHEEQLGVLEGRGLIPPIQTEKENK